MTEDNSVLKRSAKIDSGNVGASATASDSNSDGIAGIRAVAHRTGIAADTLRVWERRYGFPRPSRRPGGSRLYSEADMLRLELVARALEAGFRPSEVVGLPAVDLAKILQGSLPKAARPAPDVVTPSPRVPPAARGPAPTVGDIIEALRADDILGVRARLRAAAVALGPRAFVTEVAQPLAVRVGELWAKGLLEVRHEHVMSACLTSQLHLLLGALDDGDRFPAVLLVTLPAEPHLLGIDMVAVYLATALASPRVLGADTPPAQIVEAARAIGVDAIGLSISAAAQRRAAARGAKWVFDHLPSGMELWLGGGGARTVAALVPEARIVTTWAQIDDALTEIRKRPRR